MLKRGRIKIIVMNVKDPLVKDFVITIAGKDAYKIVKLLDGKGKTDEEIDAKLKLGVNNVRALLNQLHYLGIIRYTRKKAKNINWYTYTWFLDKDRVRELLKERYEEELRRLEKQLEMERNFVFFTCKNNCERLPFELAFEYDFRCPECGEMLEQENDIKRVKELERKIEQIKSFLAKI